MSTGKMIQVEMITGTTVKARVVVPLRSRIAGWWMVITGGLLAAACLAVFLAIGFTGGFGDDELGGALTFIMGLASIAVFIFYFLPGLLVLRGGRWGWIVASVILSLLVLGALGALVSLHIPSFMPLLPSLIPLILILSDHIPHKRGGDTNESCDSAQV